MAAEQQAAFKALGTMSHPEAIQVIAESLNRLANGRMPVRAQLELLEAAEAINHPGITAALEERNEQLTQSADPLTAYEYALLGGNSSQGRTVFSSNKIMPCIRCHVIDGPYTGGTGPSLMSIASKFDPKYLLESIIKPSNQMAEGFEMAIVTTKQGGIVVGMVAEENVLEIKLKLLDGNTQTVEKSQVATRQTAPSTMPEIFGASLNRTEMRDLVAFLTTLISDRVELEDDIEGF